MANLRCSVSVLALALWLPIIQVAHAQSLSLERFAPTLDAEGFLGVQGTRTPGPGRTALGVFTHYSASVLKLDGPAGQQIDAVSDRFAGSFSAELGIGSRLALGFALPVILYQAGEVGPGEPPLRAYAPGDPSIALRYRFVGDVASGFMRNDDGPGVALQLNGTVPAGYDDAYAGEGSARVELQLLGDIHLLSAGLGAAIGVRHRFYERSVLDVRLHDEFTFGVALKAPIPPLFPLEGLLELRGATDFRKAGSTALELDLGARYPLAKGWTFQIAAGPGLTSGVGTPSFRVLAGVLFAPEDPDSDGDGIPDDVDACPPLPEDRDGFQDSDGCPDPDNDNDLVPDADDLCPNQQAEEGHDDNEDGCTD